MNHCHICDWDAPTEANLRDHVLTCHPGQKNEPLIRQDYLSDVTPAIDWDKTGADWQAIADRIRSYQNDLIDNAMVAGGKRVKFRRVKWVNGKVEYEDIPDDEVIKRRNDDAAAAVLRAGYTITYTKGKP